MSIEDRAKATAKDVSGKVEEAVGDLTGNKEAKAKGKSKQAEAKIDHTVEDGKEAVKKTIDQSINLCVSKSLFCDVDDVAEDEMFKRLVLLLVLTDKILMSMRYIFRGNNDVISTSQ